MIPVLRSRDRLPIIANNKISYLISKAIARKSKIDTRPSPRGATSILEARKNSNNDLLDYGPSSWH
jgi:hypothetical protein